MDKMNITKKLAALVLSIFLVGRLFANDAGEAHESEDEHSVETRPQDATKSPSDEVATPLTDPELIEKLRENVAELYKQEQLGRNGGVSGFPTNVDR